MAPIHLPTIVRCAEPRADVVSIVAFRLSADNASTCIFSVRSSSPRQVRVMSAAWPITLLEVTLHASSSSSGGYYSGPSSSGDNGAASRREHEATMQRFKQDTQKIRDDIKAIDRKYR